MKKMIVKAIHRYNGASVAVRAGFWFTLCGFIQKGISFIAVPIFTRILSTEQYGIVSVFNTWEQLIAILCTFNLFYGGFNNGMRDYKDHRDEYVSSIQGLITTITIVWIIIYLIGMSFWNNLLEMRTHVILIMFVQIVALSALSLWAARERFEFRYKTLVVVTITNTFLSMLLPIIAILLANPESGAEVRIIAYAISTICVCGCIYVYNIYKGKVFFKKEFWKTAFFFNLPLLPHYLSTMILNHSDRIMIGKMVGNSEAAIYSVAYSAAMILNILATSINQSFAPWIYEAIDKNQFRKIVKVGNILFSGMALVLMILISFAPECIYIFAGIKYAEAVRIVPSVASSLYFIFMYQIFANVEFYYKRNKFIAYASMSGAILNLILNYFGIKMFGYIAAGYTTLICYIVFGIAHYVFMIKICREELDRIDFFDAKTIFAIAVGLVIFAMIMNFLYPYTIVRYIIIFLIIEMVFVNRNKIKHYVIMLR